MKKTIRQIKEEGLALQISCDECTRVTMFSHKRIPAKLVDDLPVHLAAGFFRCSSCKSKQLTSTYNHWLSGQPKWPKSPPERAA